MDNENNNMVHKRINITLPEDMHKKLLRIAEKEDRLVSNVIKRLIEQYKEH